MHRLTATDTPMVRYTRTIFPSYAFGSILHFFFQKADRKGFKIPDYVIISTGGWLYEFRPSKRTLL